MQIKEVAPEPILPESVELTPESSSPFFPESKNVFSNRNLIKALKGFQKYSVWPMLLYFPVHSINTFGIPLIQPNKLASWQSSYNYSREESTILVENPYWITRYSYCQWSSLTRLSLALPFSKKNGRR